MTPPEDIEDIDPGLARERTELAWTRTAISLAAVGAAILKSQPAGGVPVLALSFLIWRLGRLPRAKTGSAVSRRLLLITVTVTVTSIVALAVTFLGHPDGGPRGG